MQNAKVIGPSLLNVENKNLTASFQCDTLLLKKLPILRKKYLKSSEIFLSILCIPLF